MLGLAKTSKKFAKSKFEELARLARAFSLLVIEGALESGQVKFGKTDTAVFRTNGGLILTARHAVADARHWITIAAGATEAATGDPRHSEPAYGGLGLPDQRRTGGSHFEQPGNPGDRTEIPGSGSCALMA